MTWFGWTAIAVTSLATLVLIGSAGKPGHLKGFELMAPVLINVFLIVGILFVGTGRVV